MSCNFPNHAPGGLNERTGIPGAAPDRATRDQAEAWVGELLLAAVGLSRRLGVDPELALRAAADRIVDRVREEEPG